MQKHIATLGLLGLFMLNANAAETCPQIRAQIKAQTGVLARPDTALLAKVGEHPQCRFSSAEAYRAAWGDKPMPKDEPRQRQRRGTHGDRDD